MKRVVSWHFSCTACIHFVGHLLECGFHAQLRAIMIGMELCQVEPVLTLDSESEMVESGVMVVL